MQNAINSMNELISPTPKSVDQIYELSDKIILSIQQQGYFYIDINFHELINFFNNFYGNFNIIDCYIITKNEKNNIYLLLRHMLQQLLQQVTYLEMRENKLYLLYYKLTKKCSNTQLDVQLI